MTPVIAPRRNHDQRTAALAIANEIRCKRADMKRELRAGADPVPLLQAPPQWLYSMKAYDFVLALPRVGPTKTAAIFRSCAIGRTKTVGGLGDRQRGVLVDVVRNLRPATPLAGAAGASGRPSAPAARETAPTASERHA